MLKSGGRLIYAVCSMQPEEGLERVAHARKLGLIPAPFTDSELPGLAGARDVLGFLRTHPALWPEHGGMDGFYCARFIKP
jgi:16S rRNA (cytosine967-C5)-methyltransferase